MKRLSTRTKLLVCATAALLVLFLIGESDWGQHFLIGKASDDHWVRDDQYMGAGLAPIVYCAVPGGVLLIVSLVSYGADRRRDRATIGT
jgi:hypothetical protein